MPALNGRAPGDGGGFLKPIPEGSKQPLATIERFPHAVRLARVGVLSSGDDQLHDVLACMIPQRPSKSDFKRGADAA